MQAMIMDTRFVALSSLFLKLEKDARAEHKKHHEVHVWNMMALVNICACVRVHLSLSFPCVSSPPSAAVQGAIRASGRSGAMSVPFSSFRTSSHPRLCYTCFLFDHVCPKVTPFAVSCQARPQMLFQPSRFSSKLAPLPNAGTMGTNQAFLGKYDEAGQSTKVRRC